MTKQKIVLFLLTLIFVAAAQVRAQIQIGTIRGTVTDETAAAVRGAKIILSNSLSGY